VINNKGKSNAIQTVGISKLNASTHIINQPTVETHINTEKEQHTQTSQTVNQSKVGAVADFISVSEKTGNTSSISEEQQVSTISVYIPVLFWVKKFIQSQEELDWKGCIAQFFIKSLILQRGYRKTGGQEHNTRWEKVTRITREWAQAVWALGFVLILRDLIRGIKDGQSTLTKTDASRTSRFHHDIIHKYDVTIIQWRLTSSTKSSHIIPQGPHHHQELFKSSSRGLQWDFCWNPLRSFQDLGFKTSFKPRLVHL